METSHPIGCEETGLGGGFIANRKSEEHSLGSSRGRFEQREWPGNAFALIGYRVFERRKRPSI